MTRATRHPSCRCGSEVGDNPYCIIHGRIRNMDAGASPFVDPDAIAAKVAEEHGIEEEDIDRTQQLDDVVSKMHRDNFEQELEGHLSDSFDALKEAGKKDGPGCKCDYSQDITAGFGGPVTRHHNPNCPVHGDGARQEYDVDGTAEEF